MIEALGGFIAGTTFGLIITSLFAVNSYHRGYRNGREDAIAAYKAEGHRWPK